VLRFLGRSLTNPRARARLDFTVSSMSFWRCLGEKLGAFDALWTNFCHFWENRQLQRRCPLGHVAPSEGHISDSVLHDSMYTYSHLHRDVLPRKFVESRKCIPRDIVHPLRHGASEEQSHILRLVMRSVLRNLRSNEERANQKCRRWSTRYLL